MECPAPHHNEDFPGRGKGSSCLNQVASHAFEGLEVLPGDHPRYSFSHVDRPSLSLMRLLCSKQVPLLFYPPEKHRWGVRTVRQPGRA